MARSFTLRPVPDADGGRRWRTGFLPGALAIAGGVTAIALGLTWWFRKGDRAVYREMNSRRDQNPFAGDQSGQVN
jgi:hypothetical protein